MRTIRVFPRRTSYTPTDDYVFVGDPPMIRPEADEVHVSVSFTWDIPEAERLELAWQSVFPYTVRIGGPAYGSRANHFEPNLYVKKGITITTRGCNNHCPWCLVPAREGKLQTLLIQSGHIIGDNNLLQAPRSHIEAVFTMLRHQKKAAILSGGLDSRLVSDRVAYELRGLRINQLFLACDTEGGLKPLKQAVARLSFLPRDKLRCYVMIAYNGETIQEADNRLRAVWELGCLPFAQLYQPPEQKKIEYSKAWRDLARTWSRPAAKKATMRLKEPPCYSAD